MALVWPARAGADGSLAGGPAWYGELMAELGLAIFLIGALLVVDRDRLEWLTTKLRDLFEWLSS